MRFGRRRLPPNLPAAAIIEVILEIERKRQKEDPGPMLTALVVDENTGLPDARWFALARELGRMKPDEDPKSFWVREVAACHDKHGGPDDTILGG